jgi:pantoate--beta-alanine ligase
MRIITDIPDMRAWALAQKAAGRAIGFVPTMGALHEGHASLIEAAAQDPATVVSIFVNPAQFGPNEDYERYPRSWEADIRLCESMGVDVVYAPNPEAMYPPDYRTYVTVEDLSEGLESATRPQFFRGVATVVLKLFMAVMPDRAYFGRKDAQQAAVIRRMARDLDTGVEVVVMPIIRDKDGLALSSRNAYLSPAERIRAQALYKALLKGQAIIEAGEAEADIVKKAVHETLAESTEVDYVDVVRPEDTEPVERIEGPVLIVVAAWVGETRLIDNILCGPATA